MALASKKIFFGHQSVGGNIIDGMKDLMKQDPALKLKIKETADKAAFNAPVFAHARVGKNTRPLTKIEDFARQMDSGVGNAAEIAFFKFCYVDIDSGTDVNALFSRYKETIEALKKKYPKTMIVHVTVPLTVIQSGPKALLKRVLGKPIGYEANAKRHQYNELLKSEYASSEPIFDLALAEATTADGKIVRHNYNGQSILALAPEHTDDGDHLNVNGRSLVARRLIEFLSGL